MKDRCLDCGGRLDRLARPWCEMKSQHDAEEENGMSEWKPIETAPKNGTSYLATNGKKYAVLNEPPGFAKGYWEKFGKQWAGYAEMKFEPTHWMPLEPPEASEHGNV